MPTATCYSKDSKDRKNSKDSNGSNGSGQVQQVSVSKSKMKSKSKSKSKSTVTVTVEVVGVIAVGAVTVAPTATVGMNGRRWCISMIGSQLCGTGLTSSLSSAWPIGLQVVAAKVLTTATEAATADVV
jgi:hypothetical protein